MDDAIKNNDLEACKEACKEPINDENIYKAFEKGHLEICKYLISICIVGDFSWAFEAAVYSGNIELSKIPFALKTN